MQAVAYSNFRANLKSYMRACFDDAEPILVTSSDPDGNVVVVSARDWDSIQETLRVCQNPYLFDKVARGMASVADGSVVRHGLVEEDGDPA